MRIAEHYGCVKMGHGMKFSSRKPSFGYDRSGGTHTANIFWQLPATLQVGKRPGTLLLSVHVCCWFLQECLLRRLLVTVTSNLCYQSSVLIVLTTGPNMQKLVRREVQQYGEEVAAANPNSLVRSGNDICIIQNYFLTNFPL
jgi:hypothetical protein